MVEVIAQVQGHRKEKTRKWFEYKKGKESTVGLYGRSTNTKNQVRDMDVEFRRL